MNNSLEIQFTKMHGAGNDHIMIDCINNAMPPEHILPELARRACARSFGVGADGLRLFSSAEIKRNDGRDGRAFWAVVDGFVVDATAFVDSHPGGLRKLLSTDDANTGATGKAFGLCMHRVRANALARVCVCA